MIDLDKKHGIKENLITEVGADEAETIWNRAISQFSWDSSKAMGERLRKTARIPGFKRFFVKVWSPEN